MGPVYPIQESGQSVTLILFMNKLRHIHTGSTCPWLGPPSPRRRGHMPRIEMRFTTCADRSMAWVPVCAGMAGQRRAMRSRYDTRQQKSRLEGGFLIWEGSR